MKAPMAMLTNTAITTLWGLLSGQDLHSPSMFKIPFRGKMKKADMEQGRYECDGIKIGLIFFHSPSMTAATNTLWNP